MTGVPPLATRDRRNKASRVAEEGGGGVEWARGGGSGRREREGERASNAPWTDGGRRERRAIPRPDAAAAAAPSPSPSPWISRWRRRSSPPSPVSVAR